MPATEAAHEGAHLGQFFLILRRHAGHFDRTAAVRTRRREGRPVGLVDLRRGSAAAPPAIGCAGSPAGTPAAPLRLVLGEAGGLAATLPARSRQLLFQVLNLALQTIILALQTLAVAFAPRQLRPEPLNVPPLGPSWGFRLRQRLGSASRS